MVASPRFRLNGGAPGVKAPVAAGSLVTATLEDTSGIDFAEWSMLATDETATVASYAITASGSKGSSATWKALGPGTAGIVQCRINGGLDKATQLPKPNATIARAKFYVPTAAGREVICAGETIESDPRSGYTGIINALIRAAPVVNEGVRSRQIVCLAGAFSTRNGKENAHVCGACFFERGNATKIRWRVILASSSEKATASAALFDAKGGYVEGSLVSASGVEPKMVEADVTSALAAMTACVLVVRLFVEPASGEEEAVALWAPLEVE
jgi:hypothetical protein